MRSSGKGDVEKARYWQKTIREAARSGMSIRAFCRQRRLRESQFYWWQHKLRASRQAGSTPKAGGHGRPASLALVSVSVRRTQATCVGDDEWQCAEGGRSERSLGGEETARFNLS
ncbi:MAG: hypothetical protein ABSH52_00325, partial [Terriglobia bacterium]